MQPATTNDAETQSTPEPPAHRPPLDAPGAGEEALAALAPELPARAFDLAEERTRLSEESTPKGYAVTVLRA